MKISHPLTTPRITIRNYISSDLPFLTAMWFDEENGRYLSDPTKEYADEKYRKVLDGLEDNSEGYYLVAELRDTKEIVGSCFIFPDEKKENFDIGYCVHKVCWRKGIGTEIIALITAWVRDSGGAEITAEVAKENTASRSLLESNGFKIKRESRFKKYNMDVEFESYIYSLKILG